MAKRRRLQPGEMPAHAPGGQLAIELSRLAGEFWGNGDEAGAHRMFNAALAVLDGDVLLDDVHDDQDHEVDR